LAGGAAPLEPPDHAQPLLLDPILQAAQLHLQLAQRLLVLFTFQASIGSCHRFLSCWLYAPASTAVTPLRKEADERIIIFSASTTRKKTRPPRKRRGQTQSGMASLSNKICSGGA